MSTQLEARIAWSVIADPADPLARRVVSSLGYELGYEVVTAAPAKARNALRATGIDHDSSAAALSRWVPRLREIEITHRVLDRLEIAAHVPEQIIPNLGDAEFPPVIYSVGDIQLLDAAVITAAREISPDHSSQAVAEAILTPLTIEHAVAASDRAGDAGIHQVVIAAGGTPIAVFAGGVDRVARRLEARLFRQIAEQGLILSAIPPGSEPDPLHQGAQNIILAAIARHVLILGAEQSAPAVDLAEQAQRYATPVGAVMGPALAPSSAGTAQILHAGATLITSPGDAIEFTRPQERNA